MSLACISTATLLYLISKMRRFVSLRKSVLSSIKEREEHGPNISDIQPSTLICLFNIRPIAEKRSYTPSNWADSRTLYGSRYNCLVQNIPDTARVDSIMPVDGPNHLVAARTNPDITQGEGSRDQLALLSNNHNQKQEELGRHLQDFHHQLLELRQANP